MGYTWYIDVVANKVKITYCSYFLKMETENY